MPLERVGIGKGVGASGTAIATSGAAVDRHGPRPGYRREKRTGGQGARPCIIVDDYSSDTLRMPGWRSRLTASSRGKRSCRLASGQSFVPSFR